MKQIYKSETVPKTKTVQQVIDGASQVAEAFGVYTPKEEGFMPDQYLDEVTVTAPQKVDFFDKYKFYIIGGILLLVMLLKKK